MQIKLSNQLGGGFLQHFSWIDSDVLVGDAFKTLNFNALRCSTWVQKHK